MPTLKEIAPIFKAAKQAAIDYLPPDRNAITTALTAPAARPGTSAVRWP